MASKYLQKFPVPAGFQEILADFTQEVLRDQPANIIEYAAQYFEMLEKGKKMQFSGSTRKNEPMARHLDDMTKKAAAIAEKIEQEPKNTGKHGDGHHQPEHSNSIPSKTIIQHEGNGTGRHEKGTGHSIASEKTVVTQEVAKYIDKLPTDVTPDDLEKKVNNVLSETIDESVERLCKKYDAENKGYLSASEVKEFLMNLLEQMNMPAESLTDKIIEEFIESVDANNDHRISKKELKRFIADLFANQQ